jgi:CRP/FNR family transcriptional regulator
MYPNLPFTDTELLNRIETSGRRKHILKDEVLMSPGQKIIYIPIVLSGVLRIVREDDEGNEIFLYHLYPGSTCAMALNCCAAGSESHVKAIAGENSDLLMIPSERVDEWMSFREWKVFINLTYARRFDELLTVIDLISFRNLDEQILHYLREISKAGKSNSIRITHQQIADELHTQREVVSRLLKTMEQKGLLKTGRNKLELLHGM